MCGRLVEMGHDHDEDNTICRVSLNHSPSHSSSYKLAVEVSVSSS
jgi:hypothetical protein